MNRFNFYVIASIIAMAHLTSCTNELLGEASQLAGQSPIVCTTSAANISNNGAGLVFENIQEVDAFLQKLQGMTSEELKQINNELFGGKNKYLTSISIYVELNEMIDAGQDESMVLEQLQLYINEGLIKKENNEVSPLSYYDYRCLLDENNRFVVGNKYYQLVGDNFMVYPIAKTTDNADSLSFNSQIGNTYAVCNVEGTPIAQTQNDVIIYSDPFYLPDNFSAIKELTYLKEEGKHRMQVFITLEENYSKFYNRHDFISHYKIKSLNYWAGTWWIKQEYISVDFEIENTFVVYPARIDLLPSLYYINYHHQFTVEKYYPESGHTDSYPNTHFNLNDYGIQKVKFTITNQYMTITEEDKQ